MSDISELMKKNREWSDQMQAADPNFFKSLVAQQSPRYLWIGCSDSRVPATQLVGLLPGEMFVHRNVANVVVHSDLNCLSVLQFAIEYLKVEDIIICGHYECGGVNAALLDNRLGLMDNWLRHVQDVKEKHHAILSELPEAREQLRFLCELNVIEQVLNVCKTTVVTSAWERGQKLAVHGLIYDVADGLLRELELCSGSLENVMHSYRRAVQSIHKRVELQVASSDFEYDLDPAA